MIIVIEGPDGSGKTTLAKALAEWYGYKYVHFAAPKTPEEQKSLFYDYYEFLDTNDNVVIDRLWPSAIIYGEVMRGSIDISPVQCKILEDDFKTKVIMFYCYGDVETVWERATQRGEDYVTNYKDFVKIHEKYEAFMRDKKRRVLIIPYITGGSHG